MSELESGLDTFPKLLAHHAKVRGERPALREKNLGIWQTWSWRQFADEVRALASGLAAQGFKRGDHLAIAGDNAQAHLFRRAARHAALHAGRADEL